MSRAYTRTIPPPPYVVRERYRSVSFEVLGATEQARVTVYQVKETFERIEELSNGKTRSAGTGTRKRTVRVPALRPVEEFPIEASLANTEGLEKALEKLDATVSALPGGGLKADLSSSPWKIARGRATLKLSSVQVSIEKAENGQVVLKLSKELQDQRLDRFFLRVFGFTLIGVLKKIQKYGDGPLGKVEVEASLWLGGGVPEESVHVHFPGDHGTCDFVGDAMKKKLGVSVVSTSGPGGSSRPFVVPVPHHAVAGARDTARLAVHLHL